jgi:hypothetical protein
MGYLSQYSLTWTPTSDAITIAVARAIKADEHGAGWALDWDGSTKDACKWYEWEYDMRNLSSEVPGVTFTLQREGEEPGDLERGFFRDGHGYTERAAIIWPEVDEDRLKEAGSE